MLCATPGNEEKEEVYPGYEIDNEMRTALQQRVDALSDSQDGTTK